VISDLFFRSQGVYLLSHSVGLLPVSAKKHFAENYFLPWENGDEKTWAHWLEQVDNFRHNVARLLNTEKSLICPQVNLSSAMTKILGSLGKPKATKNTLLLSERDFPSLGFVAEQAVREGFRLKFIPDNAEYLDINAWSDYLSRDVFAVLITHVQSNTGIKIPVRQLTQLTREREVYAIVDTAQSAGIVPVDVSSWQADFVIGSSVKWLCGGPGGGFLWVNSDLLPELIPKDVGWFSHEHPLEFDIHRFSYANDALRFWGGTPTIAPLVIAAHSIGVLLDIGLEKIATHNLSCKEYMRQHINPKFILSPLEEKHQSGTLIVERSDVLEKRLIEAGVKFDVRREVIRISPHIYTPVEQLSDVVRCFY